MFYRIFLIHHGLALGMTAAGIVALLTGVTGWVTFTAWTILALAIYVCGRIYKLTVKPDHTPWNIDFDL